MLLAKPANDFVASFVGADRGLKRLGVTPLPAELSPVPPGGADRRPFVSRDATLREALAVLLDEGTDWVAVRDRDGTVSGVLTMADIQAAAARSQPAM